MGTFVDPRTGPLDAGRRVLVVGATGGSGRAAVAALLAAGHEVTAFARGVDRLPAAERLRRVRGDATDPDAIGRAVEGQDVVVVTLGIAENPVGVRLWGSRSTPLDVRSRGTRNVIAAMRRHGVRRLVVQTSYGVGETRGRLPVRYRLMFGLLLKEQIADTEVQEREVRASGLDWVIAQPVNLTDAAEDGAAFVSPDGEVRRWSVSRARVGRFLAEAAAGDTWTRRSVALSSG